MFWRMFQMDVRRCFRPVRTGIVVLIIIALVTANSWNYIQRGLAYRGSYDIVTFLNNTLTFDQYKVIIAFALGALYTGSVCSDDGTGYLRMILSRVDMTTYIQSRFLANALAIVTVSIASFLMFALLLCPVFSLWIDSSTAARDYYYVSVLRFCPALYVIMMGLQFGMIVAACSSIGLLFSAYQCNAFVSVGLVGMSLFCALSYLPMDTIVSIVGMITMGGTAVFSMYPPAFNYAWGMLYPTLVIVLCGFLFYRRMKWRMLNGRI